MQLLYSCLGGSTPPIHTKVHRTKVREPGVWSAYSVFMYLHTLLAQWIRAQRYGRWGRECESL